MNITTYRVLHCTDLQKNSMFTMAGVIEGEVPDIGCVGIVTSPGPCVTVELLGAGIFDPLLHEPSRRGFLVKIVEGDGKDLNNATLEFRWDSDAN